MSSLSFPCFDFYFVLSSLRGGEKMADNCVFYFMKGGSVVKNLTFPGKKVFIIGFPAEFFKSLECLA